jgi:hypothetical protein
MDDPGMDIFEHLVVDSSSKEQCRHCIDQSISGIGRKKKRTKKNQRKPVASIHAPKAIGTYSLNFTIRK